MKKLKTLKDFDWMDLASGNYGSACFADEEAIKKELRQEAIKLFKNLQWKDTIYPLILNKFPDKQKGSIAKRRWDNTNFRYGAEYGMLAVLHYFFNLKEENLK